MPFVTSDRGARVAVRRVVGLVTGATLATAAVAMTASAAPVQGEAMSASAPMSIAAPLLTSGLWIGVGGVGGGSVVTVTKPVAKKPVVTKPIAKKPVAKKPVAKKPAVKVTTSIGGMPTLRFGNGTTVSTAGLSSNAIKVLRVVNGTFPMIRDIGTIRGDAGAQDHATGHAVDLMIPSYNSAAGRALGTEIAAFMRAHASQLGVHYIIWSQHIWNVQRASEGWRAMPDRGGVTANHYDHVHVSVY